MMNTGWNCPACGRAHGPHVDTCPERPNDEMRGGLHRITEDQWATWTDRSTLDAEATTSSAQPPLDVPSMPL